MWLGTFDQYLPYFQNKNVESKNMQYENVIFFSFSKTEFGFEKAFFQKVHLEKGGRLITRVILYSGQYGKYHAFVFQIVLLKELLGTL